jgi:transposase
MATGVSGARIVPEGYEVLSTDLDAAGRVVAKARVKAASAACPGCGATSRAVHSRYRRTVSDLPLAGRKLRLEIEARRFRCRRAGCRRHIFCERLPASSPWARRTGRLETLIRHWRSLSAVVRPSGWPAG